MVYRRDKWKSTPYQEKMIDEKEQKKKSES